MLVQQEGFIPCSANVQCLLSKLFHENDNKQCVLGRPNLAVVVIIRNLSPNITFSLQ